MSFLQDTSFLGNELTRWLTGLAIALATYLVLRLVVWAMQRWVTKYAHRTSSNIDDLVVAALGRTKKGLLAVAALYAGSLALEMAQGPDLLLRRLAMIALLMQIGLWLTDFIGSWAADTRKRRLETDPGSVTGMTAIAFMAKLAVWVIIALLTLDNLGVNITTLVAGLGIGGIAVALAAEPKVLLLDEPFAGMHMEETNHTMDLVRKVQETGVTIILVEHDMKAVMGLCGFITVLNFGS